MDTMKWYFHKDIDGTHLLFESFQLADGWNLLAAYIFIVLICWTERGLTYFLDQYEYKSRRSRWIQVFIRTFGYGLTTVLRLWYMLSTMYFNTGLFIVVIFALSSGQLVVEILKSSRKYASALILILAGYSSFLLDRSKYMEYTHPQYDTDKRPESLDGPDTVFVLDDRQPNTTRHHQKQQQA